jgi:hypothetical protein
LGLVVFPGRPYLMISSSPPPSGRCATDRGMGFANSRKQPILFCSASNYS